MYKYWVQITVVTPVKLHLNTANNFQDVVCRSDYYDRVVACFAHQIQSEYYGGNGSVSIDGIELENFSALPHTQINSSTKPYPRHAFLFNFVR